jgi:hypothetical protein
MLVRYYTFYNIFISYLSIYVYVHKKACKYVSHIQKDTHIHTHTRTHTLILTCTHAHTYIYKFK